MEHSSLIDSSPHGCHWVYDLPFLPQFANSILKGAWHLLYRARRAEPATKA